MDRFARVVLGYHGAKAGPASDYARALLVGDIGVEKWQPSENEYDWLGHGIYFWEYSPERAQRWAGADGIVIGAVIQFGNCLDLTDLRYTELLKQSHAKLVMDFQSKNLPLPKNTGRDLKLRKLDCLVINSLSPTILDAVHTVRGAFEEGDEAFPGSALKLETHIQIAVRQRKSILGLFRPTTVEEASELRATTGSTEPNSD